MEWKYYWVKVVARYHVMINGWPATIPFKNLSIASSPLADVSTLLQSWQEGKTSWKLLTPAEAKKLVDDMKSRGEVEEPAPRHTHSDRGKKRKQRPDNEEEDQSEDDHVAGPSTTKRRKPQKAAISQSVIDDMSNHGSSDSD
jgi:hypothetical protein